MLRDMFLKKTVILAVVAALALAILTFLQYNRSSKSGVRSETLRIDEKLFLRQIAAHNKSIEACERARGNWPRRYGSPDGFCKQKYPYPLIRRDKTLGNDFTRSLSQP